MKRNILFFVSVTQIGGTETNVIKIAHELSKKGYKVHFATLENNGTMFEECRSFAASLNTIGVFYKSPFQSAVRFWKLLKEQEIDVVLNFGMRVEFFSRLVTKLYSQSIKVISNIRSTDTFRRQHHVFIDRLTFPFVDKWVSNSIAGKNAFVEREGIPPERIDIIYNYIELPSEPGGEVDQTKQADHSVVRIGILANIRQLKGYYDLIPLTRELLKEGVKPLFVCGGVDHTQNDFINKVKENHLEPYFELRGYVEHKGAFFESIDLFMLPSYMEGMPTVILEAMVYGKPVISTLIGGIPEQITHEYNGLLYEPGDIKGFARGIVRLKTDSQLRRVYTERSKEMLSNMFLKEPNLNKWLKIIEK